MQNLRSRRGEGCSFDRVQVVYAAGSILGKQSQTQFQSCIGSESSFRLRSGAYIPRNGGTQICCFNKAAAITVAIAQRPSSSHNGAQQASRRGQLDDLTERPSPTMWKSGLPIPCSSPGLPSSYTCTAHISKLLIAKTLRNLRNENLCEFLRN